MDNSAELRQQPVLPLWGRGTALVAVEGSEAVRPNEFHTESAESILQLVVSAIADDPTTIAQAQRSPAPTGADYLAADHFSVFS